MKRTVISATVLALAISGAGVSQAAKPADSGFKVTGGGQIIADDAENGPGDTVGFVAQELEGDNPDTDAPDDLARGQFQYVPRGASENDSAPTEKFHGVVTCLISGGEAVANEMAEMDPFEEALMEGSARFGGVIRGTNQAFTVDVTDNGEGGDSRDDMILVRLTGEPCADNPEDEDTSAEEMAVLGRGNVTIHNNPDDAGSMAATALR